MNSINLFLRIAVAFLLTMLVMLTGCTVTYTPYDHYAYDHYIYDDHPHTTEVYYYNDLVYFGYYSGFYYYYGVPHYYPWWYYYQFLPSYHYHAHTHIHVHCDNGYYVYHGHRKNRFDNKNNKEYKGSTSIKNDNVKTNTFPRDWKSNNSTKNTKNNNRWNKVNINQTDYNRIFNGNFNKSYNKRNNTINISKNNTINKGNNGSTRPNKTRINQKKKR